MTTFNNISWLDTFTRKARRTMLIPLSTLLLAVCSPKKQEPACNFNDANCGHGQICISYNDCVDPEEDENWRKPRVDVEEHNGVSIKQGITNPFGKIFFQDDTTGDEFPITVMDENDNMLADVLVNYFDGSSFDAFYFLKPGYVARFDIFSSIEQANPPSLLRTSHPLQSLDFSLASADYTQKTVFEYSHDRNPEQTTAFGDLLRWGTDNTYTFQECMTKEELRQARKRTCDLRITANPLAIPFSLSYLSAVCWLVEGIERLDDDIDIPGVDDYPVYDIFMPTLNITAPPIISGHNLSNHDTPDDRIDNDCNDLLDDLTVIGPCRPHASSICVGNNVYSASSCGNLEDMIMACASNEICSSGECKPEPPPCTPQADQTCYEGNVHWIDSCGTIEEFIYACDGERVCSEGSCFITEECNSTTGRICLGNHVYSLDICDNVRYMLDYCTPDETCTDGVCVEIEGCVPEASRICFSGDAYLVDSCGSMGDLADNCGSGEVCNSGNCVESEPECTSHTIRGCNGNDVHWFDSCGNLEERILSCMADEDCVGGKCLTDICFTDADCDSDYICQPSTGNCLPEPEALCIGSSCITVSVYMFDSGPESDDSFGLEIVGLFYGETPYGGERIWTVPMVPCDTYDMRAYGVGIPDGIGTYTIELANASVLSGPPLTGTDLDAGESFSWEIKPGRSHTGRTCYEGDRYWTNSCDEIEDLREICEGFTTCNVEEDACLLEGLEGKIAFSAVLGLETLSFDIYTMDANARVITQLTHDDVADTSPTWSPNGRKIAYSSYIDGYKIFVMDADGRNKRLLTDAPGYYSPPSWSPDGTRILYSVRGGSTVWHLNTITIDDSVTTTIYITRGAISSADWSPDGGRIVFAGNRDEDSGEIYTIRADGTDEQRLTNNTGYDARPQWSPGGSKIMYTSNSSGSTELHVMNADGSNKRQLTSFGGTGIYPIGASWSPDGTKIIVDGLYIMNADGTNITEVPDVEGGFPDWAAE